MGILWPPRPPCLLPRPSAQPGPWGGDGEPERGGERRAGPRCARTPVKVTRARCWQSLPIPATQGRNVGLRKLSIQRQPLIGAGGLDSRSFPCHLVPR